VTSEPARRLRDWGVKICQLSGNEGGNRLRRRIAVRLGRFSFIAKIPLDCAQHQKRPIHSRSKSYRSISGFIRRRSKSCCGSVVFPALEALSRALIAWLSSSGSALRLLARR
jgi:hypothetical protein